MEVTDNPFLVKLFYAFETKNHFAFVVECKSRSIQIVQEGSCSTG